MVELIENSVVLTDDASANFLRHVFCRDDDNHLSQPQPYFFDDIQIHELDDGFSVNIEGLEILDPGFKSEPDDNAILSFTQSNRSFSSTFCNPQKPLDGIEKSIYFEVPSQHLACEENKSLSLNFLIRTYITLPPKSVSAFENIIPPICNWFPTTQEVKCCVSV